MPELYLFGGRNGAGKTTTARRLLPDFLSCREFVNADAIASALSPFRPETSIPDDVIRRRYGRGLHNFFKLYVPLCGTWTVLDNSAEQQSADVDLIAVGGKEQETIVRQPKVWERIQAGLDREIS